MKLELAGDTPLDTVTSKLNEIATKRGYKFNSLKQRVKVACAMDDLMFTACASLALNCEKTNDGYRAWPKVFGNKWPITVKA